MDVPSKAAAVFVSVGLAVGLTAITAEYLSEDRVTFREAMIPDRPCKTEDGPPPCFWDAGARADGQGHSFWIEDLGGHVRVHYLDPRAKKEPVDRQPYGGCDEAYLYPQTEGARWCRAHGYE